MSSKSDKIQPDLVLTRDGSHTLYSPRFQQHYHNPNGAAAESRHVFFETSGLAGALASAEQLHILEIGLGTGLNLLLLMDQYLTAGSSARITYHSIEAFPITGKLAASFNYEEHIRHPELTGKLADLFDSLEPGLNHLDLMPGVQAYIFHGFFEDWQPEEVRADYIFHDAFSPGVNQELWTGDAFKKLKECSSSEVILTTYCAASKARGAMAWAGWYVARARGALGKREMTVASLSADKLEGFKRVNEQRLARRYRQGDFS